MIPTSDGTIEAARQLWMASDTSSRDKHLKELDVMQANQAQLTRHALRHAVGEPEKAWDVEDIVAMTMTYLLVHAALLNLIQLKPKYGDFNDLSAKRERAFVNAVKHITGKKTYGTH